MPVLESHPLSCLHSNPTSSCCCPSLWDIFTCLYRESNERFLMRLLLCCLCVAHRVKMTSEMSSVHDWSAKSCRCEISAENSVVPVRQEAPCQFSILGICDSGSVRLCGRQEAPGNIQAIYGGGDIAWQCKHFRGKRKQPIHVINTT